MVSCLCFRSLVSDVHSRLKSFPGSAGSDDQRTQDKNYLAAIQADVRSLLSKSKVYCYYLLRV